MPQKTPPTIAVYCGAKSGDNPQYVQQANTLGNAIAHKGWQLVFGSSDMGIMGAVFQAVKAGGGHTIGVTPKFLAEYEKHSHTLDTLIETETMHQRKQIMADTADAFVILPGGVGTLDEFFEILTWRKLAIHAKPIVIVNVDGYWDNLITLLDGMKSHGFLGDDVIPPNTGNPIPPDYTVVDTADHAIAHIQQFLTNPKPKDDNHD